MHGYHAHRARAGGVGNAALERQCRLLLVGLARLLQRSTGGVQQGSGASRDHRAPEQACAAPMGGTESLQGPRAGQVASMFTDRRRFFCDLQDRSGWSSKHGKKNVERPPRTRLHARATHGDAGTVRGVSRGFDGAICEWTDGGRSLPGAFGEIPGRERG